jgi:hypothetical protein
MPRPRFALKTLMIAVTACAVASLGIQPVVTWLFPPKPETEFEELMRLITETVKEEPPQIDEPFEANVTIIYGGGQVVHPQSSSVSGPTPATP